MRMVLALPDTESHLEALTIRVLIADDHSVMRRGMRSLLLMRQDVEVCAEAVDGRDALNRALTIRPDLIVLDLSMPEMGGLEVAKVLRRILPEIPIIVYSMHEGERLINEVKEIGVQGFVCKTDHSNRLLDAIEAVVDQKSTFFPDSPDGVAVLP